MRHFPSWSKGQKIFVELRVPTIGLYTLAPKGPTNLKMVLLLHILHYMSGGLSICSSSTKETCGHMCKEPHMYVCVCVWKWGHVWHHHKRELYLCITVGAFHMYRAQRLHIQCYVQKGSGITGSTSHKDRSWIESTSSPMHDFPFYWWRANGDIIWQVGLMIMWPLDVEHPLSSHTCPNTLVPWM